MQEGLKDEYENANDATVRDWTLVVMAMTACSSGFRGATSVAVVEISTNHAVCLRQRQAAGDLHVLRAYTWISGDFQPSLWTHFDNNGQELLT